MARIALVAGPDAGHAYPVAAIAVGLRGRGHEVLMATGPQHEPALRDAGVGYVDLPLLAPTSRDHDLGHRLWGRAGDMAPPLAARLRGWRPDLVVADVLTTAGGFAADLLGVPWVQVSPHHLIHVSRDLPPIGLGRSPHAPWWRRRDDARLRRQQATSLAEGERMRREARRRAGLGPDGPGPVLRLVATLPGLEYPRSDWPDDARVVGPLEFEPDWPELALPDGGEPLVVVTDTTASAVGFSLAEVALDALRDLPIRLVATTGRDDLRPWPTRCAVGRGPHRPLLERADLGISLGGHGFVAKALARGVPLVVTPWHGDQRETAARLRWSGAGRSIHSRRLTGRRLRWAVLRVLADDRHRQAAERLARGAAGLGRDHTARLLERECL